MLTTIDHIISLLSSTAIATAAVVLAMIHFPHKSRWVPMSQARWERQLFAWHSHVVRRFLSGIAVLLHCLGDAFAQQTQVDSYMGILFHNFGVCIVVCHQNSHSVASSLHFISCRIGLLRAACVSHHGFPQRGKADCRWTRELLRRKHRLSPSPDKAFFL